ncbi:MAG: hypothetical protein HYU28_03825 [Actinobacteria bacterium]|nr:hypothetical protein [Actinomycetota bacterium]
MTSGREAEPPAEEAEAQALAQRRRRFQLIALLTPLSLAIVAGYVGAALTPTLLQKDGGHPLALIAIDARNRNLILTANSVAAVPFYTVAVLRLLAVDPFTYLLGRRYGDAGLRWVETRFSSLKPTVDFLERLFRRAGWLAVAIAPGAIACTLAGAAGMSVALFFTANILGTVTRIFLLRELGFAFAGPVDAIRRFFDRYIWWTTAASVVLTVWWFWSERKKGAADAESPAEMADELEEALDHAEEGAGPDDDEDPR